MSVLGLIVEYNPLHNGHLYHFNTSLAITQAEYSICVISGNFVQRGEPALLDKWARASMALNAGIDLVIELPAAYSIQSAEFFAYGAVSILNSLGIVDTISFGSECGDIALLKKIGFIISSEPEEYKDYIKYEVGCGNSFAAARAKAILKYIGQDMKGGFDCNVESVLQSSNNILGLEYIKWINRLKSSIQPVTVKRMHSQYNDLSVDLPFASAMAVREAFKDGRAEDMENQVPSYTKDIMEENFSSGKGPVYLEDFSQVLLCMLRQMDVQVIHKIMDVSEGLEYKIKKAAAISSDINELICNIKSKRYAETRIRRILTHILLNICKKDMYQFSSHGGPQYIRVLGFNQKGRKLLSLINKSCNLPVITNTSDYRKYNNPLLHRMMELDILATDIYVTAYKSPGLRKGGLDFYNKPVVI